MQCYDPNRLIDEVRELLRERGLDPAGSWTPERATLATGGAAMLLRGLGVTPAMDPVEGVVRAAAEPWTDADDRRAASGRV
jgi:hypothetical protein